MADDVFPYDPDSLTGRQELEKLMKGTGVPLHDLMKGHPDDRATEVEETVEPEDAASRVAAGAAPRSPTTINLFQHPDAHPFVLDLALLRKYGPDWMGWEPEVLEARILQDFKTNSLSDLNADKLMAIAAVHLQDGFWTEWHVFNPIALALAGSVVDFRVMQGITVPQALIAVDVVNRLRTGVEWSLEMKTYLSVVHHHDGMFVPIAPLEWVEVDASDHPVDVAEVRRRWDEVRSSNVAPPSTSAENVQLERMLVAWNLLEENRKQLQDQLPLLYHGRD